MLDLESPCGVEGFVVLLQIVDELVGVIRHELRHAVVELSNRLVCVPVVLAASAHDLGSHDARHEGDGELVADARVGVDAERVHAELRLEDGELRLGHVAQLVETVDLFSAHVV